MIGYLRLLPAGKARKRRSGHWHFFVNPVKKQKNGSALTLGAGASREIRKRAEHCGIPVGQMAQWMAQVGVMIYDGKDITIPREVVSLLSERSGELLSKAGPVAVVCQLSFVDVTLQVPPSAAEVFPSDGIHSLLSAGGRDADDMKLRCGQWKSMNVAGAARSVPPTREFHAAMMAEGPSVSVHFRFAERQWTFIEEVAAQLGITTGDYLLGHVGYQVLFVEKTRSGKGGAR